MKKAALFPLIIFLLLTLFACGDTQVSISENEEETLWDMPPCLMVDGQLYRDTGGRSHLKTHPEEFDGYITSEVPGHELPTENNQSNFGSGFGYNFGQVNGTIEIYYNDDWWLYALDSLEKEIYTQVVAPFETQDEALAAYMNMQTYFDRDEDGMVLTTEYPANYCGCYIDENNVLNICVSSPTAENLKLYQEVCETRQIYIQPATYTKAQLNAAADALTEYNESHDPLLCYSWGVDEKNNCVSITITENMLEEAERLRKTHPCIVYEIDFSNLTPAEHPEEKSRDDIILEAEYDVYPTDTEYFAFLFKNNSDKNISYTDQYLEILQDGIWYTVPYRADVAFTAELPNLSSGKITTVYERTDIRNFDFIPGTYRVGQAYCYDEDYNGNNADYIAWAKFELRDDATLPEYAPLEKQSMDVNTAVMDGCAVIVNDTMVNFEAVKTFCEKSMAMMKCELRIVNSDTQTIYHIIYEPDQFTVTIYESGKTRTRYYAALCVYPKEDNTEIVLSTYRDLASAVESGYPIMEEYDILTLAAGINNDDPEAYQQIKDKIWAEMTERLENNYTYQIVKTPTGDNNMNTLRYEMDGERIYDLGIGGSVVLGWQSLMLDIPESEDHPVYVFHIEEYTFGVVFALASGGYEIQTYDISEQEFLEIIPVETSLEETIMEMRIK